MFDYKQEIGKYKPLPEPEEANKLAKGNDVEDIMDILNKLYSRLK